MTEQCRAGPLAGVRVVEFASIGPGPHCAMLLSDLGAEVLRIDRPGGNGWPNPVIDRGRHVLEMDIRTEEGRTASLELCACADVIVEGFRPGVMERLGLGPDEILARNPRVIYGRMTGWGQTGPLAQSAGHDINYIALTGALAAITDGEHPIPPLNLVGDFGGGSLYLAVGIAAALFEQQRSGRGQVVDAAIVDGTASLMAMFTGLISSDSRSLNPDRSLLGGQAPFYRCYRCADGKYVSVGPLEPRFYADLIARMGSSEALDQHRNNPSAWPDLTAVLQGMFAAKTRDEWCALLAGTDACFAPVLSLEEAMVDPHIVARDTYLEVDGVRQPAPAPRFSRTPGSVSRGGDGEALRRSWFEAIRAIGGRTG